MTLNDIIVSALAQLDRGHDSQTVDTWRDKLTRYANEAVSDLATLLRLQRTDELKVENGVVDTSKLPRCCVKVLKIYRGNERVPFIAGPNSTQMKAICSDGPVSVEYRFLPNDMSSTVDEPELPKHCHGLIVTYVVARERASGDPATQRGANIYFELYNASRRKLRASMGAQDDYNLINRW